MRPADAPGDVIWVGSVMLGETEDGGFVLVSVGLDGDCINTRLTEEQVRRLVLPFRDRLFPKEEP